MKKIILLLLLIFSVLAYTEPIRKLSVTGNAEKEVMPDIARMNFRIYTKNEDLKKAGKENETNFENFKNELKKKNISITNLTTNNYFTQKSFEAPKSKEEKEEFLTTLVFSVKVTDYSKIPSLIELAEKNSIKNFTCSNGSPPVTVTPPPDKFIYVLYLFTFSIISSNVFSSPNVISHVSLLWQYLHFKLHPCKNKTNLIPGPSTVPKLSIECTFATLFNLFSM